MCLETCCGSGGKWNQLCWSQLITIKTPIKNLPSIWWATSNPHWGYRYSKGQINPTHTLTPVYPTHYLHGFQTPWQSLISIQQETMPYLWRNLKYCTKPTNSSVNVTCDSIEEMGQLFKVGCDSWQRQYLFIILRFLRNCLNFFLAWCHCVTILFLLWTHVEHALFISILLFTCIISWTYVLLVVFISVLTCWYLIPVLHMFTMPFTWGFIVYKLVVIQ